mgnify:FL=1|tara:strand:+ start:1591 stop:1881 length:291 start_codon:yes stop_codon:yes gene_type:complete
MTESPDAVLIYVPLMKNLGMSWAEIKRTPRMELRGLLAALNEYDLLHAMDGYDDQDIASMAKNKPKVRQTWARYLEQRAKYDDMVGKKRTVDFSGL